jgi:hypothetical protein
MIHYEVLLVLHPSMALGVNICKLLSSEELPNQATKLSHVSKLPTKIPTDHHDFELLSHEVAAGVVSFVTVIQKGICSDGMVCLCLELMLRSFMAQTMECRAQQSSH